MTIAGIINIEFRDLPADGFKKCQKKLTQIAYTRNKPFARIQKIN